MLSKNTGMTLAELMVVIAIFWIIGLLAAGMNFTTTNNKEKRDRITNAVVSTLRSARTTSISGRSDASGVCSDVRISLTSPNILTGALVNISDNGSVSVCGTGSDSRYSPPADIWNDPFYRIASIEGIDRNENRQFCISSNSLDCTWSWGTTPNADRSELLVKNGNFSIKAYASWTLLQDESKNTVVVRMHVGYREAPNLREAEKSRTINLDLRSGKIAVGE